MDINTTKGFLDIAVDFAGIDKNASDGRDMVKTTVMMGVNPEIEKILRQQYGIEYSIAMDAFRHRFTKDLAMLLADINDLKKTAL